MTPYDAAPLRRAFWIAAGTLVAAVALPDIPHWPAKYHLLGALLTGAWTVMLALRLESARREGQFWHRNTPFTIAPEAVTAGAGGGGLYCGLGFRWNAQYTQALETVLATAGALPVAEDAQGGHPALHAVGRHEERGLVIPWSELGGHALITGTTGSGKTRVLEVLATEAIAGEGAVIVIDPKGDREWMLRCGAEARRRGKPLAVVAPVFPQTSARLNVLHSARTPAEVSARIRALMPSAGGRPNDPFFEEYPLALVEKIAAAQAAIGHPWTLEGLYKPSVLRPHMESLTSAYLQHLGHGGPDAKISARIAEYRKGPSDLLADALLADLEGPRDHFTKVTSNLIPAFRGVVGEPMGALFSTIPADITWESITERQMVVYIALGSLLLGDIANRIGRVILQDLVGFLGHRYAYTNTAEMSPVTVLIDEFSDVAYPGFTNALNKGRGAGARFILAQQSLADAEAPMGEVQARRVRDNLNTQMWCRLADDRTAAEATEGLGLCTVTIPDTSVGLSFGGVGGLSGSSQRRLATREVPLVRPTWLTAMPKGHMMVRMKGEVWKVRVPLLPPVSAEEQKAMGLETLWEGMKPEGVA